MIYAAHILDSKFVKIGFSTDDVEARLGTLQTGCPFQIKLLFAVEGTIRQEKALHASLAVAFARIRLPMPPNEWYPGRNTFLQQFLELLRFGAGPALAFTEGHNTSVDQPHPRSPAPALNIKWPVLSDPWTPSKNPQYHGKAETFRPLTANRR